MINRPTELNAPERITLRWLWNHAPMKLWAALLAALAGSFSLGVTAVEGGLYQDIKEHLQIRQHLTMCSNNIANSCVNAGDWIDSENGFYTKDDELSANLYSIACDLNSGRGCRAYARRLKDGKGVPIDQTMAKEKIEKACELRYRNSCIEKITY